jgi:membrane protein DedA with SNARE-associated domain
MSRVGRVLRLATSTGTDGRELPYNVASSAPSSSKLMHSLTLVTDIVAHMGYAGVFLWMAVSACIPIPSEVVLPFAGALVVTKHMFNFHLLAIVGALGNLTGSVIAYQIGASKGRAFFEKYGRYMLIRRKDIDGADRWFAKHGEATVFFTRMMPVIRAFISWPAGIARMPFGKYCLYTLLGSLVWCYFLTWLGVQLGNRWDMIAVYFHKADLAILIILVALVALWLRNHLGPEHASTPAEPVPEALPDASTAAKP